MPKDCAEPQRHGGLARRRLGVAAALALMATLAVAPAWAMGGFFSSEAPPEAAAPPAARQTRPPPAERAAPAPAPIPPARRRLETPPPRPIGDYQEGKHYYALDTKQPSSSRRIEVIEFFWYGCPHCALFEPHLRRWVERQQPDVHFTESPAVWRAEMEPHARAYYTAKALGRLDDVHSALFNALAMQHQPLHTESALADFFAKAGIVREEFEKAWSSFSVARSPAKAKRHMRAHGIGGTPTMVVAGAYQVRAQRDMDMEGILRVVDYLVARERYERYLKGQALRERARQAAEADAQREAAAGESAP